MYCFYLSGIDRDFIARYVHTGIITESFQRKRSRK